MSDPQMIYAIQKAVSIPIMAKVRIGHFVEAQVAINNAKDFSINASLVDSSGAQG